MNNNDIHVGDIVVCRDNYLAEHALTIGSQYKVVDVFYSEGIPKQITVNDNNGDINPWMQFDFTPSGRFVKVISDDELREKVRRIIDSAMTTALVAKDLNDKEYRKNALGLLTDSMMKIVNNSNG